MGFFKRGLTAACLKADGKTPWIKEQLKIDKRLGATVFKTSKKLGGNKIKAARGLI